jgi:L-Ala-D/L-Glu epimerase
MQHFISNIEIYKLAIPLKKPFKISLGIMTHAENVVVKIHTTKGVIGFGECSPFLSINGESIDTAFIVGQNLAQKIKGMDSVNIEEIIKVMDTVIYGNTSIKSAFDMALYDINAQIYQQPLYQYLGGNNLKKIVTDYTVSFDEASIMAKDALAIKQNGFTIIKVKLGGTALDDIERIKQIRATVGMEIPIRIDANQGWDVQTAIIILQALEPYNIQHCEEPIARWNYMQLNYINENSPIKIMADESCCNQHDAARLIQLKACTLLNVKLGKSGGIFNALQIIKLAEENDMYIQLGGFLESRLAFTAATHLAMCSPNIIHFDFDTCLMFTEDPVVGGIKYTQGGNIHLPASIGIGASFDEAFLNQLPHVII